MDQLVAQISHGDARTAFEGPSVTANRETATNTPLANFATVPDDVQYLIIDHILASNPTKDLFRRRFVIPRTSTATTLLALRRVSRPWQSAVDAKFPGWHLTLDLLAKRTEPLTTHATRKVIIQAPLPQIPTKFLLSLALRADGVLMKQYLDESEPEARFDTLRAPNVDLARIAAWAPNIMHLLLNSLVWDPATIMPTLTSWSATLTALSLTVGPGWNRAAATLELPVLRTLIISNNVTMRTRDDGTDVDALPIAPLLEALQVSLKGSILPEAIAQYASTLRSMTVLADGQVRVESRMPHWPALRNFTGSPQVFFQLIEGQSELPALVHLSLLFVADPAKPAKITAVPDTLLHLALPNLSTLSASVALVADLTCRLYVPRLAFLHMSIGTESAVPDLPWPSITTMKILRKFGAPLSPVAIHGSMLDALPNLITLQLPPIVTWIDGVPPILPHVTDLKAPPDTFASFPDHALPSLMHAAADMLPSPLIALPADCGRTLRRLDAMMVHPRLVELLACMPALETFRMARIQEPQRLVEWRLAYVEGNPIWSVVPMTQAKNQIAEKLVVGVSVVNDVERMAAEIKNMAYWCAESSLLVDGILVHQNGVGEEDWFPVEVHVVPEAGSQVQQRVEQLVEELREQYEIAARVMYVSAPLP